MEENTAIRQEGTSDPLIENFKIGNKFRLIRKIGSGAFGVIYGGAHYLNPGINISTNEEVAIKLERRNTRHPQLDYEARVYKHLIGTRNACLNYSLYSLDSLLWSCRRL